MLGKRKIPLWILLVAVSLTLITSAYAATVIWTWSVSTGAHIMSPGEVQVTDYEGNPIYELWWGTMLQGGIYRDKFIVTNTGKSNYELTWKVSGEPSGTTHTLEYWNTTAGKYKPLKGAVIEPNEQLKVKYTVMIDMTAPTGDAHWDLRIGTR